MHILISERMDDMKKFGKFLLGSLTVATAATGLYYLYKNFVNKDYTDDFDEFDDDLEPDSDIEESLKCTDTSGSDDLNTKRDYVSIHIKDSSKSQDSPKSDSGIRDISVSNRTMLMLKQWQNRQRVLYRKHKIPTRIVFASAVGGYRTRANIAPTLDNHYNNAGISLTGFHAFRHTHASLLLNAGADYKEIQHRLGHAKIGMTIDTYSHLAPDKAKETASIYEKAIEKLS